MQALNKKENKKMTKLIMPQELEVWYLLPALRRELAKELLKLNLKQSEIARKLGTSRAAITQYLNFKRANEIKFDKKTQSEIKNCAKSLVKSNTCLVQHMQYLCKVAKHNKVLCSIHKCNHVQENCCEVCLR